MDSLTHAANELQTLFADADAIMANPLYDNDLDQDGNELQTLFVEADEIMAEEVYAD